MAWYDSGSVSVTNGSTTVTGSGTDFIANVQVGSGFYGPDDKLYEIASITSATVLVLADNYGGSTASGQAYKIVPTQSLVADLASDVIDLVSEYETVKDTVGAGKFQLGSAAAPSISFTGDTDTGFYRSGSNAISVSTAGTRRLQFDTAGMLFLDNQKLRLGGSGDLQLYHDGSNSFISDTGTGNLFIQGQTSIILENTAGTNYLKADNGGSVYLYHQGNQKLHTDSGGVNITGRLVADGVNVDATYDLNIKRGGGDTNGIRWDRSGAIDAEIYVNPSEQFVLNASYAAPMILMTDDVERVRVTSIGDVQFHSSNTNTYRMHWDASDESLKFLDNASLKLGSSNDLWIHHDGSNSYVKEQGTGNLYLTTNGAAIYMQTNGGERMISAIPNSYVHLYYDDVEKFRTTSAGTNTYGRSYITNDTDNTAAALSILHADTNPNAGAQGILVDMNCSGSDALTTDRVHAGIQVDVDSSATGGDTNHEHRLYGIHADARSTGDSDMVTGIYAAAQSNVTAGTTTILTAGDFYTEVDDSGTGRTANAYGVKGQLTFVASGTGGTTAGFAGYFRNLIGGTQEVTLGNQYGVYAEVEIDPNADAVTTVPNVYGVFSTIDNDSGAGNPSFTNSYIFYGSYAGTAPSGNHYGIYISPNVNNYFGGNVKSAVSFEAPKIFTNNSTLTIGVDDDAGGSSQRIRFQEGGVTRGLFLDDDFYVWNHIRAGRLLDTTGDIYHTTNSTVQAYAANVSDGSTGKYLTYIQAYDTTDNDYAVFQSFTKYIFGLAGETAHSERTSACSIDTGGRIWAYGNIHANRTRHGDAGSTNSYGARDGSITAYSGTGGTHGMVGYRGFTNIIGRESANTDDVFQVGVGYVDSSGGQLKIEFDAVGNGYFDGGADLGNADYAEYFEWEDGNPNNEDRRGYPVALAADGKIKIATSVDDDFLGIVSVEAAVCGDSAWAAWSGKWAKDKFGQNVFEDYELLCWGGYDEETDSYGVQTTREAMIAQGREADIPDDAITITKQRQKLSDDFDPTHEYIPRKDRQEWQAIGLMGKLPLLKGQPTDSRWRKLFDLNDEIEMWLVR